MNLRRVTLSLMVLSVIWLVMMATACESKYEGVPRIGLEELKAMLGNPDLIVVDVRAARDWETGDSKIKGSVREDPKRIDQWAPKYPKDKTIVFYCA